MSVVNSYNLKVPKGIICYYSGSGNTRLACQYIQNKVQSVKFDLFNIARSGVPDLDGYAVAGFATFTDFWGPPHLMQSFIEKLSPQNGKPAFVFNTYGAVNGKTLLMLGKWASAAGFKLVAGHTLHTPESYPPMVAGGHGNEDHPDQKELKKFQEFVSGLDRTLGLIKEGKEIKVAKLNIGLLNSLLFAFPRTQSRKDMGLKYVDDSCDECGICEKICPYGAVKLNPKPVFDMHKCYGCWSCYNHCPKKAIYTRKFRGVGHYPKPNDLLKEKLKA
jgi:ferredoxin